MIFLRRQGSRRIFLPPRPTPGIFPNYSRRVAPHESASPAGAGWLCAISPTAGSNSSSTEFPAARPPQGRYAAGCAGSAPRPVPQPPAPGAVNGSPASRRISGLKPARTQAATKSSREWASSLVDNRDPLLIGQLRRLQVFRRGQRVILR